jgi:predicted transcriptional regulator
MRQLNGSEIAKELGISRQAVSYSIRKSMGKMYGYILSSKIADTPFQAILSLMIMLGMNHSDVKEVEKFVNMFDKKIIDDVKKEAMALYNIKE